MLSDVFGWNFFFSSKVPEFQHLGLNEIKKYCLVIYLLIFTVFPRKEKKRKYCILKGSVQITILIFSEISRSACVAHVFSVFPTGEIRNREVKVRVTRRFFFFFLSLFFFVFFEIHFVLLSLFHFLDKKLQGSILKAL